MLNRQGRALVVCYSRTGNTARVARDLAARLHADLEEIRDKADRQGPVGYCRALYDSLREMGADIEDPQQDPGEYALTVIGTPVWAYRMTPAVRAYLSRTKGRAAALAFFVTSGATEARRVVPRMEQLAGRKAGAFTGFDARALKDPVLYEKTISAFVAALERARRSAGAAG